MTNQYRPLERRPFDIDGVSPALAIHGRSAHPLAVPNRHYLEKGPTPDPSLGGASAPSLRASAFTGLRVSNV